MTLKNLTTFELVKENKKQQKLFFVEKKNIIQDKNDVFQLEINLFFIKIESALAIKNTFATAFFVVY